MSGCTESRVNNVSGSAGITSLNGLSAVTQIFANGSAGTAPAFVSAVSTHTLNIPLASAAAVTAGLISKTDYDTFNGKVSGPVSSTIGDIPVFGNTTGNLLDDTNLSYVSSVFGGTTDGAYAIGTSTANRFTRANGTLSVGLGTQGTNATSYLVLNPTRPTFFASGTVIPGFAAEGYGSVSALSLKRAQGTPTVPTAVTTGNVLGDFLIGGFDGTVFFNSFEIVTTAQEPWSSTNRGVRTNFLSTLTGAAARAERLNIDGLGAFNFAAGSRVTLGGASIGSAKNLSITGETLDSTFTSWEKMTGTFPNTAAIFTGVDYNFTTAAGTNASTITGLRLTTGSGYTGAGNTYGLSIENLEASTAGIDLSTPHGNHAIVASCGATGTEHCTIYGQTTAGTRALGIAGTVSPDTGGVGIGSYGGAIKTTSSGVIAGYFKISTSGANALTPFPSSGPNAAIIADNDDTGNNIFTGQAVGTSVFEVQSTGNVRTSGNVGVGNSAAATTPGNVTKKIEIFNFSGTSLGFLPVYDAIT